MFNLTRVRVKLRVRGGIRRVQVALNSLYELLLHITTATLAVTVNMSCTSMVITVTRSSNILNVTIKLGIARLNIATRTITIATCRFRIIVAQLSPCIASSCKHPQTPDTVLIG